MYRHLRRMTAKTRPRLGSATGQGLVEYALILALVAVLAIGGLTILGGGIKGVLDGVGVNAGGGGAVPSGSAGPSPSGNPGDYHDRSSCEAAGYVWHHVEGPDFCSASPVSPSEFDDEDRCEEAGFFWIERSGPDYCSATPAPTPTPDPYPHQEGGPCDANGGVWDRNGSNWECDHPTPRGTPPPPNPAGQAGDWCDPSGSDRNGSWVWRTQWDGDGSGHWDTSWFCDGSLRNG